jgi:hypothetical protein
MKKLLFVILLHFTLNSFTQNITDVSLFLKRNNTDQLTTVESKSGNLFTKVGHHGPAVENRWYGLRIYFNKTGAIDVYSKARCGLELREKGWYPNKKEQKNGWGADYYKVGNTLGLGGICLWNGKNEVLLNPVSMRTARVLQNENSASMEMLSEGVPYKGKPVDILVRVTVYSDNRKAKVEAFSLTGEPVQFVTGINYHKETEIINRENYIATWGIHPEDVAAEKVEVGAAVIFNRENFQEQKDDGKQILLISKPAINIETMVTTANEREQDINSLEKFIMEIKNTKY